MCCTLMVMNMQTSRARCLLFLMLRSTLLLASMKCKWLKWVRQQDGKCKLTGYRRGTAELEGLRDSV